MEPLLSLPVREAIGRYKYTVPEQVESEYEKIQAELDEEIAGVLNKKEEY